MLQYWGPALLQFYYYEPSLLTKEILKALKSATIFLHSSAMVRGFRSVPLERLRILNSEKLWHSKITRVKPPLAARFTPSQQASASRSRISNADIYAILLHPAMKQHQATNAPLYCRILSSNKTFQRTLPSLRRNRESTNVHICTLPTYGRINILACSSLTIVKREEHIFNLV